MQAHPQIRHAADARNGVGCSSARHHQAGSRKNALAVRLFNGFVDFDGKTEIIGRDDEPT